MKRLRAMEAQSWRKMKEEAVMLMLMLMAWPLKTHRGDAFSWSTRTSRSSTHGSPRPQDQDFMLRSSHVFRVSSVDCCPTPRGPRARHRPSLLLFTPAPPRRPGPGTRACRFTHPGTRACLFPPFRAPPAHPSRLHSPPPRPRPRHRPAVSRSPRARPRAPPRPPTLMLIITALGLIVRPKHLVAASA